MEAQEGEHSIYKMGRLRVLEGWRLMRESICIYKVGRLRVLEGWRLKRESICIYT